ncbi:hypothetical protein [Sandaracinus amylolyticus]|nr:hypothetical protein [Sandaracinus amylolyticus]
MASLRRGSIVVVVVLSLVASTARAWAPGTRHGDGDALTLTVGAGHEWRSAPQASEWIPSVGVGYGAWGTLFAVALYYGAALVVEPVRGELSLLGEVGLSLIAIEMIVGLGWSAGPLWAPDVEPDAGGLGWHVTLAVPIPSEISTSTYAELAPATELVRFVAFVRARGAVPVSGGHDVALELGIGVLWGHSGPRNVSVEPR